MLSDVVVDTNVFEHTQNPGVDEFASAIAFCEALRLSQAILRVDEAFADGEQHSILLSEYRRRLKPQSLGYVCLTAILAGQRVLPVTVKPTNAARKFIQQSVAKPVDRRFLVVASCSDERILVSHDFEDFQAKKRKDFRKAIGVRVLTAEECLPELQDTETAEMAE